MLIILSLLLLASAENLPTNDPCANVENSTPIYDEQSNLKGCRLEKVHQGSLYEKLGLKTGDLVVAKNGTVHGIGGNSPDSPQKAMQMYQSLKTSENMDTKVERGGKKKKLQYKVE